VTGSFAALVHSPFPVKWEKARPIKATSNRPVKHGVAKEKSLQVYFKQMFMEIACNGYAPQEPMYITGFIIRPGCRWPVRLTDLFWKGAIHAEGFFDRRRAERCGLRLGIG
jgi:hypothetical protein